MSTCCTAKEFFRLMKVIGQLSDGQASIEDINWEDEGTLETFTIVIRPNAGFYKGGTFKFQVRPPNEATNNFPYVWCLTDIYHPNIDPTDKYGEVYSNVCLNLFDPGTWESAFGLEEIVVGLLFLMHNPNCYDPVSPYFEPGDEDTFKTNVKLYLAGEEIEGHTFSVNFKADDNEFSSTQ